ncbi:MAG: tetratricopeptide repeat protein [Planctomycetaceae bacterium]|nr:tetratricopeptide repeat protein [Planctomycetaceae bacterium]
MVPAQNLFPARHPQYGAEVPFVTAGRTGRRQNWLAPVSAVALLLFLAGTIPADEPAEAPRPNDKGGATLRQQPGDDLSVPLVPAKPRTASEQARLEAAAHYMAGRVKESRNDFRGALEEYRESVKLDPEAVEVYRELVPLAFSLDQTDEALKYALKAIELDPHDFELLRRLGVHMAGARRLPEAVKFLEKAAASDRLDQKSSVYVTLQRDLSILYGATGDTEKAAAASEIVFNALTGKGDYTLDFRTRSALEADPTTAFDRLGRIFMEAGKYELAVRAFKEAIEVRKGSPGVLSFHLAEVYLKTEQPKLALEELQKYFNAQLQSRGEAAYILLRDILKSLDRSSELIGMLEGMSEKDSRNATLLFFLADQYLAADQLDDAEKMYQRGLESSGDRKGHLGLAVVYRRRSDPSRLLESLSQAVRGVNSLEGIETELQAIASSEKLFSEVIGAGRKRGEGDNPPATFEVSWVLAGLAAEAEKTDIATEFYRQAIEKSPGPAQLAGLYQEFGQYLLLADEFDQAADVFREAAGNASLAGGRANFLFRLSQALEFGGKTQAALDAVEEALKLVPEHPLLHYQTAWIYYHSRQYDRAISGFEEVLKKFPDQKDIVRRCQYTLSNLYVQQGDIRKGEEILEKVLAEDPDDPSVNNDLGYLYADQGKNLEQAEKMIRKALDSDPENGAYLDSMGWVLFKLGRYKEAATYLEKAVENQTGSDGTILDHLADCYDRLGRKADAVKNWKLALEQAKKASSPDKKKIEQLETKLKGAAETSGDSSP